MVTKELLAYIQQESSLGASIEEIKNKLLASGWSEGDIQIAIQEALHPQAKKYISENPKLYNQSQNEFNNLFHESVKVFRSNYKKILLVQTFLALCLFCIFLISRVVESLSWVFNGPIISIINILLSLTALYIPTVTSLTFLYMLDESFSSPSILYYLVKAFRNSGKYLLIEYLPWILIIIWMITSMTLVAIAGNLLGFIFPLVDLLKGVMVIGVFIGMVIMYFWFLFSGYVFVSEKAGIISSLIKSKFYAEGNVLRIFKHAFLIGIIFIGFNLIPIIGQIVSFFFAGPLYAIFFFELYKKIRYLKTQ